MAFSHVDFIGLKHAAYRYCTKSRFVSGVVILLTMGFLMFEDLWCTSLG